MVGKTIKNEKIGILRKFPKFETPFWLWMGIIFGIILIIDAVWSMVYSYQPFFPFQIGRIFRIILGLVLAIHSIDILIYRKKHNIVVYKKDIDEHRVVISAHKNRGWLINRIMWWFDSIKFAWSDMKFRMGVLLCTSGIVLGVMAGVELSKITILITTACLAWGMEIVNSCVETLMDMIQPEYDKKVKIIKDAFSAVPIFGYTAYTICWLIIVLPTLWSVLF